MRRRLGSARTAIPAKVVDASLVAAWCFREDREAEAAALLYGGQVHAPLLLAYELANIARRKAAAAPERAEFLVEALATASAIVDQWEDVDHQAVVRLALSTGLTAYDASYLFLARRHSLPLLTFDERLGRAAAQRH